MTRRERFLLGAIRFVDWLCAPYHHMQRSIDIVTLWPECCRLAYIGGTSVDSETGYLVLPIDRARAAFAMHAMSDPAWRALGADEICRRIDALPWRLS